MNSARRLLAFVRPYRREAILSLVLLGALVCLDLAIPRLIQRLIDQGIARGDRPLVLHTALLMLVISALSTAIAIGNNVYSVRVGEGVARDLREALFLKIQSYSYPELDRQKTGNLLVRLTSDVSAVKSLIQVSLRIGTRAPLMIAGSLILMISTSARLALFMFPLLLVTAILIGFFIVKTEPLFRTVQGKLDLLNNVLQENIAGARLVKSLVRAPFEEQRFARANHDMTERSIAVMQFMSAMMPALTLCINVGMVVVVWVGGLDAIRGRLSVGEIVAFTNYMLSTMIPLVMMTVLSNMWAAGLVSAARVQEVLGTAPQIVDAPKAVDLPFGAEAGGVVFDDVSFGYDAEWDATSAAAEADNAAVLRAVAFHARPGQTIAILGATGAGKSTLVNLIPRFYDVTAGAVRIRMGAQEQDVRLLKQDSLLAHIAVVPQESLLFSGTIRDNISYGRPEASDSQVRAAAEAAQAHQFIAELPGGYQARVEARGTNLSGGQKQRLALARALLLEAAVLILDDSTSAVDVETETRIQDALAVTAASGRPRTTFVVAQRISTVLKADQILVLERGRIVASGTHQELMRSSAVYQEIYESQLGGGIAQIAAMDAAVDNAAAARAYADRDGSSS